MNHKDLQKAFDTGHDVMARALTYTGSGVSGIIWFRVVGSKDNGLGSMLVTDGIDWYAPLDLRITE